MRVAAAELHLVGAPNPVQEPAGVLGPGVGAHQVEDGAGVVDEVAGQLDGAGEDGGVDRLGPAVAEVAGQMEEGGEAAGGAGELGRPAGQMRQVAAVPVIASGGAGALEHFAPAIQAGADAVLAASVFHSGQLTVGQVKDALAADGIEVRR